eukprot:gene4284-4571_t
MPVPDAFPPPRSPLTEPAGATKVPTFGHTPVHSVPLPPFPAANPRYRAGLFASRCADGGLSLCIAVACLGFVWSLGYSVYYQKENGMPDRRVYVDSATKQLMVQVAAKPAESYRVRGVNFSPPCPALLPHPPSQCLPPREAAKTFNTIRVYNVLLPDVHSEFLQECERLGVSVIITFWMDRALYPDIANDETARVNFRHMVRQYKRFPAVLMWAIGNEPNLPDNPYSFANMMSEYFSFVAD